MNKFNKYKIGLLLALIIILKFIIREKAIETFQNNSNNSNNSRNMVFTSCGNNTNFHNLWCNSNRNYDIYAIYYGEDEEKYKLYQGKVDWIEKRKASKFQNFHYFYQKYPEIINKYDRFFILDDDIIFSTDDINEMFSISKKYNLTICGPTFKNDGSGKISHQITIQQPKNLLRYVNFIEVNVPLFNREGIDNLMKYYDPILIGWGVDYLMIWANGLQEKDKYALIDKVSCINPRDKKKNNKRELNLLKNANHRSRDWENIRKKLKIPRWKNKNHSTIPL